MTKIKEYFDSLEEREKIILSLGLLFLTGFILINFIIVPVHSYKKKLETGIRSNIYQAQEIEKLGEKYRKFSGTDFGGIKIENKIALFSFMDSLAGKTGLKEKIDYIKPSKEEFDAYTVEKVEVKLSDISMKNLVSFLYEVESSTDLIIIKGLLIKRSEKGGTITSTIQAETIKSNA